MKRVISILLTLALALSIAGCSGGGKIEPVSRDWNIHESFVKTVDSDFDKVSGTFKAKYALQPETHSFGYGDEETADEATVAAMNDFCWKTAPLLLEDEQKNFCYSPVSLYYATAMAAEGASGETARQLYDLLESDPEHLAEDCEKMYRRLYSKNEVSQLLMGNSVWLNESVTYNGAENAASYSKYFLDDLASHFYASVFQGEFGGDKVKEALRSWSEESTDQKIRMKHGIDKEALMALINVIYFRDQWSNGFEPSRSAGTEFIRADGSPVFSNYMHRTLNGWFDGTHENYTAASLDLRENGEVKFYLPKKGVTATQVLAELGERDWSEPDRGRDYNIEWSVPKFFFDYSLDPRTAMETLGVTDAFSPQLADFSRMTDVPACVSAITQGTHIGLNEVGVEASGTTSVSMGTLGQEILEKKTMNLNHPFIFTITSKDGVVLFVGVCGDPTAEE